MQTQQKEIWKDVPGYEGYYQVSNLGNVKSLSFNRTGKEKNLSLLKSNDKKYYKVRLWKTKEYKTFLIHQLVAMAFLNHKLDGTNKIVVDHINNNSLDNCVENLQLISNRENSSKDRKNKTSKYTGVHFNKTNKNWYSQIRINGKKKHLGCFDTQKEAYEYYKKALISIENNLEVEIKKQKKITSKYKYIFFNSKNKKWLCVYKKKYLGSFKTEEEAFIELKKHTNSITLNQKQTNEL